MPGDRHNLQDPQARLQSLSLSQSQSQLRDQPQLQRPLSQDLRSRSAESASASSSQQHPTRGPSASGQSQGYGSGSGRSQNQGQAGHTLDEGAAPRPSWPISPSPPLPPSLGAQGEWQTDGYTHNRAHHPYGEQQHGIQRSPPHPPSPSPSPDPTQRRRKISERALHLFKRKPDKKDFVALPTTGAGGPSATSLSSLSSSSAAAAGPSSGAPLATLAPPSSSSANRLPSSSSNEQRQTTLDSVLPYQPRIKSPGISRAAPSDRGASASTASTAPSTPGIAPGPFLSSSSGPGPGASHTSAGPGYSNSSSSSSSLAMPPPPSPSASRTGSRSREASVESRLQSIMPSAASATPIQDNQSLASSSSAASSPSIPQRPSPSLSGLTSRRGSQLTPLVIDDLPPPAGGDARARSPTRVVLTHNPTGSADKTPTIGHVASLDQRFSAPDTPKQPGAPSQASQGPSPATPKPWAAAAASKRRGASHDPEGAAQNSSPEAEKHHHHHHHRHIHLPRLPHHARKSSADLNRTVAKGRINPHAPGAAAAAAAPYIPGAYPVAPSYHEHAHPDLQPPRLAFNVLDGPASRRWTEPMSPGAIAEPKVTPGETLPPPRLQRPAIKVKVITWNMGGASLPKGDLEVLLGRVGGYVPPDADWDADVESSAEEDEGDESEGEKGAYSRDGQRFNTRRKKRRPATRSKGIAGQEDVPRYDRIPPLPHDDGHPYHLLIVAGQECPWGDGKRIATGLGVAGELSDLARTKSKAHHSKVNHKEKDKEGMSSYTSVTDIRSPVPMTPAPPVADGAITQEYPFNSPPPATGNAGLAFPQTPGPGASHGRVFGGKGWSDMCEDWLCRGPVAQTQATKGLAVTTEAIIQGGVSSNDPSRHPSRAASPEPLNGDKASGSTPGASATPGDSTGGSTQGDTPNKEGGNGGGGSGSGSDFSSFIGSPPKSISIVGGLAGRRTSTTSSLAVPLPSFGRSNSSGTVQAGKSGPGGESTPIPAAGDAMSRTPSPLPSPAPSPAAALTSKDFANAGAATTPGADRPGVVAKEKARQQLHLQIPGQDNTPLSLGAYELIAKERCAMIYMAVYCWRGCRDRVRGVSRSHVKSGLLAGRVGNKGAVGISVKLGRTRMLFVNSHLAAHEGRVQTRLDNIAKIKRELRLDTFLPSEDPRNSIDDVTGMFDHAFWFGDLNFRVDITRQHADWLVMNKRYDQALEFDQLRKVMKEGVEFRGFNEHEITFPPTFKYDPLKSIKKPKRERTVRRILYGRGHSATNFVTSPSDAADDPDLDSPVKSDGHGETQGAEGVGVDGKEKRFSRSSPRKAPSTGQQPTITEQEQEYEDQGQDQGQDTHRPNRFENLTDDDTSSVSSAAWDSFGSSGFTGQMNTDSDDDASLLGGSSGISSPVDPVVSSNTNAAAQGGALFSHGAAIKAKWRIMDMMRSATGHKDKDKDKGKSASSKSDTDYRGGDNLKRRSSKRRSRDSAATASSSGRPAAVHANSQSTDHGEAPLSHRMSGKAGASVPSLAPATPAEKSGTRPRNGTGSGSGSQERVIRHERSLSSIASVLSPPLTIDTGSLGKGATVSPSLPSSVGLPNEREDQPARQLTRTRTHRRRSSAGDADAPYSALERRESVATKPMSGTGDREPSQIEQQPYDTSAKQRVPSWTDRVLWRSNVPIEGEEDDKGGGSSLEALSARFSKTLSNAMRAAAHSRVMGRSGTGAGAGAGGDESHRHLGIGQGLLPSSASAGLALHHAPATRGSGSRASNQDKERHRSVLPPPKTYSEEKEKRARPLSQGAWSMGLTGGSANGSRPGTPAQVDDASESTRAGWFHRSAGRNGSPSRSRASSKNRSGKGNEKIGDARPDSSAGGTRNSAAVPTSTASSNASAAASVHSTQSDGQHQGPQEHTFAPPESLPRSASSPYVPGRGTTSASTRATPSRSRAVPASGRREERYGEDGGYSAAVDWYGDWRPPSSHREADRGAVGSISRAPARERSPERRHAAAAEEEEGGESHRLSNWWSSHIPALLTTQVGPDEGGTSDGAGAGAGLGTSLAHSLGLALPPRPRRPPPPPPHAEADAALAPQAVPTPAPLPELIGPPRGQVECLLYKSLDDREMRALEGRSDHRPVIWVGSVGV